MEMETPEVEPHDSFGKLIGIQTAILAVFLSIFTITAHREHTNTLLFSNEASNAWAHYQAKRVRAYQLEMNTGLIKLLAPGNAEAPKVIADYGHQQEKYRQELEEIKTEAETKTKEGEVAHHKAGYFDFSEGLIEIAVILSSLYFISRKKLFPSLGLLFGIAGLLIGVVGLLIH